MDDVHDFRAFGVYQLDQFGAQALVLTNAAGGVRNFNSNLDAYNFNPTNYFQRPDTKYSANFFAHYDATPKVRVYTEFDFMNDKTQDMSITLAPGEKLRLRYRVVIHPDDPKTAGVADLYKAWAATK